MTKLIDDKLEVTVYGDNGNVVVHYFAEPFRATEEQHTEIIRLVEDGMRADEATRLVLSL